MELTIDESREDVELARLAREAGGGRADAFERLAARVRGRVRAWALRLTRDADDAEDVAQDVLLKLHEMRGAGGAADGLEGHFAGRSRFTTWLYRVTRNVALDRRRTAARRAALLAARDAMGAAEAASAREPDLVAEDAERLARLVERYLGALPARQREVFEMVELRGRSAVEVAAELGIEPSTVRVTLLKARRAIRARMLAEHPHLLEELTS